MLKEGESQEGYIKDLEAEEQERTKWRKNWWRLGNELGFGPGNRRPLQQPGKDTTG